MISPFNCGSCGDAHFDEDMQAREIETDTQMKTEPKEHGCERCQDDEPVSSSSMSSQSGRQVEGSEPSSGIPIP